MKKFRKFPSVKKFYKNQILKIALMVNEDNFGFAFNDIDLSDRTLHIKIVPEDSSGSCVHHQSVKILHISSPILASKSPFFHKLFKNGMKESTQRDVTMVVNNASEEAALIELIYFMYHKTLRVTSAPDLLDVLMAADKFEVTSCMAYCIQLVLKCPMSLESALSYLELPSSFAVVETIQPLVDASKQYLVARYKDFTKCQEELMGLPLSALEVVLGGDGLQVNSEDDLFDFILKWARAHYTKPEERREILTKHLARFMNFPCMSSSKLNEVVVCPDFDKKQVLKLAFEALCPKNPDEDPNKCNFLGRVYNNRRLIKVVDLEYPWPHCVVYFDLKRDECASLFPSNSLYSQSFLLGGRWFSLQAQCTRGENCFGLFLIMSEGSEPCKLDMKFAVMKKSSKEFDNKWKSKNHELIKGAWGWKNMFQISWTEFMSDESEYFIDGIIHLKAEVIIHSQA